MILEDLTLKKKTKKKSILLIFLVILLTIFTSIDLLTKELLFTESIILIEKLQYILQKTCLSFVYFLSYLGSQNSHFLIIFISYNFVNIYKTYLVLTLYLFAMLISNMLNLIYSEPQPYFSDNNSISYVFCDTSYGKPSQVIMTSLVFYISYYKLILSNFLEEQKIVKENTRKFPIIIVFSLILIIIISQFCIGATSLDQIFNSLLYGGLILYISFVLLNLDGNNSNQFLSFVEFKTKYYILSHFVIFTILTLILIFRGNYDKTERIWLNTIRSKCGDFDISHSLENQSFFGIAIFFSNIGCYLGLKCEFLFIFGSNSQNFQNFNFSRVHYESLLSALALEKDTQWNHTSKTVSMIRILVNSLFCVISIFCHYTISWDDSEIKILIFKIFLPFTFTFFGLFFLMKFLLKYIGLVNSSVLLFNSHIEGN